MLDLGLDEEQEAVAAVARDIGLDVLDAAARDAEAAGRVPPTAWRALFESGLAIPVPVEHGGGGVPDAVTHTLAATGLGFGDPGIAAAACWAGGVALLVALAGSDEQAKRLLPRFATEADLRSAVALYEGFGRAPSEMATTIEPAPGGRFRVRGHKVGVAHGDDARLLAVVGREPASGRLLAALVEPTSEGVEVEAVAANLALDAARLTSLAVDLEIAASEVIGVDAADGAVERAVDRLRLLPAAIALGCGQRAVGYAADYANERVAFGQPIAAFQGVSFMLAEAHIRLEAARLELLDAAARSDDVGARSETAVSDAVNHMAVVTTEVTRDAVQVLGGHGFITDHPVERWYRASTALSVLDFDPLRSAFAPAL